MRVYTDIDAYRGTEYAVVTVGTFDGLHTGHQKIIGRMKELAKEHGGEAIVVTFEPHPRLVLYPDSYDLKFINTKKRKYKLLEELGIDAVIEIEFTREFSKTSSDDFVKDYLVGKLHAKKLIVGYDHHFGKNREGNYEKLKETGAEYGFGVEEIEAQYVDDTAVSSTKIRNALTEGDVDFANKMLGYDYSITGTVVKGNAIGHKLGFPTANIETDDAYKLIAAGGVYACRIEYEGKLYNGMGNIGIRPTIGKHEFAMEVNIFDFDKDIYGKEITIFFVSRLRDEVKFDSLEALKEQLGKDREAARKRLG